MADFQLILLNERNKPVRTRPDGAFCLIPFRSRVEIVMAERATIALEQFKTWLTPHEALEIATEAFADEGTAKNAILEWLRGGQIHAAANSSAWEFPLRSRQTDLVLLDPDHWTHIASQSSLSDFWVTAQIRFYHGYYAPLKISDVTIRFYGIRLDPAGVRAMVANAPAKPLKPSTPPASAEPSALNKGGRPKKDFWDDLWIEVCAHIHEQGIPEHQADIENAMLNWAAENGHDLSVSSVRPKARKLLHRLRNPRTKT